MPGGKEGRRRLCGLFGGCPRRSCAAVPAGGLGACVPAAGRTGNTAAAARSVGHDALAPVPLVRASAASPLRISGLLASEFR